MGLINKPKITMQKMEDYIFNGTPDAFELAPKLAKYKWCPETAAEIEIARATDLDIPFKCYSIGNEKLQTALVVTEKITSEQAYANAKLIAAAPDLLAACIKALAHHQGGHSEIGGILRDAIEKAMN